MVDTLSASTRTSVIHRGQGLVIAFHCVPWGVEHQIEEFWIDLRAVLQAQGQDLLLVTTTPLHGSALPFILLPFNLPDLALPLQSADSPDPSLVLNLANWYSLSPSDASGVGSRVFTFISQLLDSVRPAAVISWQSAHPLSRITRELCQKRDVPWWSAERGWLRDTLMIDLCENNGLGECARSLGLRRALKQYVAPEMLLEALKLRAMFGASVSRYSQAVAVERLALRERFGLPPGARVFAWLTHGEPHVNAIANKSVQANHGMSTEGLQEALLEIASELKSVGAWLVIREHPFNKIHNRCLALDGLSNVFLDDGYLDDLLEEADYFLFTLSTIQFELALRGKPFGLLARSLLSWPGEAPFRGDFGKCADFLQAFVNEAEWKARLQEIQRKTCFLFEHQLIDLASNGRRNAASDLGGLLSNCNGAAINEAIQGLRTFLAS